MKVVYNGTGPKTRFGLVKGKEYHVRFGTGYRNGQHVIRVIMDDDDVYSYASIQTFMRDWKIIEEEAPALMDTIAERDARLEELWDAFGDVPMNPETEKIEEDFLMFPAGTDREDIWHWFDERYSKGVHSLLYGGKSEGSKTLDAIMKCLPNQPRSYDTSDNPGYWSREGMILCSCETESEIIADFLEDMLRETSDLDVHTGCFDPEEDRQSGECDDFTGFYYIDFD